MDNENKATIIIEEDQGPMVQIPLERYEALVRADTLLALLHSVEGCARVNYSTSMLEEVLKAAPDIICPVVRMKEDKNE